MLDDTLALHETWGVYLASAGDFPSVMGLRPEDLGELFVVVTYGLVLFPPLFLAYFRSTPKVRSHAHLFFIFFGLLLFCGVFLDILHMMVLDYTVLRASVSILEDAGEIVSLSLMVAFAFVLLDNEDGGLVLPFLPWQKKAMARSEVEPPKVLV
ncbi:MAG: hypothetical protein D6722_21785 [Bacteroidetes bacterium]|nr:MAG: hypothetical protein D6722_21785 [Bacteroidota bacterium]